jgi:hypothetical protein
MQTPQGLDATHSDEPFPVKREYIGNSGAFLSTLVLAGGEKANFKIERGSDVRPHKFFDLGRSLGPSLSFACLAERPTAPKAKLGIAFRFCIA